MQFLILVWWLRFLTLTFRQGFFPVSRLLLLMKFTVGTLIIPCLSAVWIHPVPPRTCSCSFLFLTFIIYLPGQPPPPLFVSLQTTVPCTVTYILPYVLSSQGERDRTAPSKLHCVKAAVRQNNSASIEHSVKTARDKIVRDQTAQHQCGTATK